MRVTQEAKAATREKLLEVAEHLFKTQGFHETTSRDLAAGVGIAAGTIFNYFPSKEAIVLQLIADRLDRTDATFQRRQRAGATLEEDLFLYIATGVRQLQPLRSFVAPALDTHLGPGGGTANDLGETIRSSHLEFVSRLLNQHGHTEPPTATELQMYWLLYSGVLAFWAKDSSRKQEATLALLDQSMKMFVSWLGTNHGSLT